MDAQAQDRAHRIGQTKPVLVYRLVSAHTIEDTIMQRATEKRKLEALVIAKGTLTTHCPYLPSSLLSVDHVGKFKKPAAKAAPTTGTGAGGGTGKAQTMADMAADLLRLEGEKIDVVPDFYEDDSDNESYSPTSTSASPRKTKSKRKTRSSASTYRVLSDKHLDMLLDRSPAVFEERGLGWNSSKADGTAVDGDLESVEENKGEKAKGEGEVKDGKGRRQGRKAAFAVYEAPKDQGNDALAAMLGEDFTA